MGRSSGKAGQRGSMAVEAAAAHRTVFEHVSEPPHCPPLSQPRWHLWIDQIARPGYANMAIDVALLDRAERQGERWLRLYQWHPHCLSFGRHEPATRRYDVERIGSLGLDTVRRPTGGRAVWHGWEQTYAVAAPIVCLGTLQAAYLEIHEMLRDALRELGAATSLAPRVRSTSVDAGACFSQSAGGEVMVDGRKVIGSAQLRRGAAFLQHGSVMLEEDQSIVLGLSRSSVGRRALAVPLATLLGRPLQSLEVAHAVAGAATARWCGAWERVSAADHVLQDASEHFAQFQSPAWTWSR
jgi:lipoate-protein ligase A